MGIQHAGGFFLSYNYSSRGRQDGNRRRYEGALIKGQAETGLPTALPSPQFSISQPCQASANWTAMKRRYNREEKPAVTLRRVILHQSLQHSAPRFLRISNKKKHFRRNCLYSFQNVSHVSNQSVQYNQTLLTYSVWSLQINIYTRGRSKKVGNGRDAEVREQLYRQGNTKISKAVKLAPQSQSTNCQLNHIYELHIR